jgi:hypothetical protein
MGLPYTFEDTGTGHTSYNVLVNGKVIGVTKCHPVGEWRVNWKYRYKGWQNFRGPVKTRRMAAEALYEVHKAHVRAW